MNEYNHKFKKKFGQNFIRNADIIKKIVSNVNLKNDDLVIEIGPGSGNLTIELAKKSKVLAYEIDKDLKTILNQKLDLNQVCIIWDDFLKRNVAEDLRNIKYNNLYVVANLPYYITTPIIQKLIDEKLDIKKIVIMVQSEVGDRFCALPGTKDYSSLTVYLNYYFDIEKCFEVNRKLFVPVPNVDSSVISLTKKEKLIPLKNDEKFFNLIKDSFKYKRKNLRNNLKNYDLTKIEKILIDHGNDLSLRAEQLSLDIFVEIANII